jgi:predicted metal-binding membrane protein
MQAAFGGLIAVILLALYVHLVRLALLIVDCVNTIGCTKYATASFNDGMVQALSIIGGLVSALVIAELAITKPGEAPVARALAQDASPLSVRVLKIVSTVYVLVWIVFGLLAFVVGLYHPRDLPALTNLGQAWLGLAVAAAYAYFGLKPS